MRNFHKYIPEHDVFHVIVGRDLQLLNFPRTIVFGMNKSLVLVKEFLAVVLLGHIDKKSFKISYFDEACGSLVNLRPTLHEFVNKYLPDW